MKRTDPFGVWQIADATTLRTGIARELFQSFTVPLIDSKIYSYPEGVAQLVLKDNRASKGYVFADEGVGTVRFFFDERLPGVFDSLDLPCTSGIDNTLVAGDGTNSFTLRKLAIVLPKLDESVSKKLQSRNEASAMLKSLSNKESLSQSGTTSSDGEAYRPGVQGK